MIDTYDTGTIDRVFRIAVSPSGNRVYASDPISARLLVYEDDELLQSISGSTTSENTRDIAISDDGTTVYVTNQDSDELLIIDAATGSVRSILSVDGGPRGIAVRSVPLGRSFDVEVALRSDFDGSGNVAFSDFLLFASAFGLSSLDHGFDARFDLDNDLRVGFSDFLMFAAAFGFTS